MTEGPQKYRLQTAEIVVQPGERTILHTPPAETGFVITGLCIPLSCALDFIGLFAVRDDHRCIYAPEQAEDFEDFMLGLLETVPSVTVGERLVVDALNPTTEPITAKVTFSGSV